MYALLVRFELEEGHENAFDDLVDKTLRDIEANEPETIVYLSHASPDRSNERVFYELYADDAAFDAHEQADHVRRFLTERQQHLRGEPEVSVLRPMRGMTRPVVC